MKVGQIFSAIILSWLASGSMAAPSSTVGELEHCRSIYNAVTGHITSSEGEEATATIWKLLFHDIDIDGDEKLTSSDVALFLGRENFVHETDVFETISEAADWIKVGDDGDGQLTIEEFNNVVTKTVAQKQDAETSAKYSGISASLCHLFTHKVPHIAESMVELETCAKHLEESILSDKTRRAEFNSWSAIFETLDANQDKKVDFEEIKHAIKHPLTNDDDISLANALGQAVHGTVYHDVKDIDERGFYVFAHELLYGGSDSHRTHYWEDVTTEHELRGRAMLCNLIRDVRTQLIGQRNLMDDCIKSYQATRQRILGADGVFAPEIVFTMVDADKDGSVSRSEFDAFIGSHSTLFNVIEREHAAKEMKIDEFRSAMPDEIVQVKKSGNVNAVLELSSMTSTELHEAENLCNAIISSVEHYEANSLPNSHGHETEQHNPFIPMSFKGSGEYLSEEHTLPPHEEEDVEHAIDHQGQEGNEYPLPETDSWHGNGHYEWVEHTLPHEDVTTHDTMLVPPAPTRPSEEDHGIVYHMVDSEGHPIEIHLSQIEIDDIIHRMAMAQEVPLEPTERGHLNEHEEHPNQSENTESEHSEVVQEIERILLASEEEELPTASPPSSSSMSENSHAENNEEEELRKLIEEMEKGRENQ